MCSHNTYIWSNYEITLVHAHSFPDVQWSRYSFSPLYMKKKNGLHSEMKCCVQRHQQTVTIKGEFHICFRQQVTGIQSHVACFCTFMACFTVCTTNPQYILHQTQNHLDYSTRLPLNQSCQVISTTVEVESTELCLTCFISLTEKFRHQREKERKSSHLKKKKIGCYLSVCCPALLLMGRIIMHAWRGLIHKGQRCINLPQPFIHLHRQERIEPHQFGSENLPRRANGLFDTPLSKPDTEANKNFSNFLTFNLWPSQNCRWTPLPPNFLLHS